LRNGRNEECCGEYECCKKDRKIPYEKVLPIVISIIFAEYIVMGTYYSLFCDMYYFALLGIWLDYAENFENRELTKRSSNESRSNKAFLSSFIPVRPSEKK